MSSKIAKGLSLVNAIVAVTVPLAIFIYFAKLMNPHLIGVFSAALAAIEIIKIVFPLGSYEALLFTTNYKEQAKSTGLVMLVSAAVAVVIYFGYVEIVSLAPGFEGSQAKPFLALLAIKLVFDLLLIQPLAGLARQKNYLRMNMRSLAANLTGATVGITASIWLSPLWGMGLYYATISLTSYLLVVAPDPKLFQVGTSLVAFRKDWNTIFIASQVRILAAINNFGDQLISGIFLGPVAVAQYNLGKRAEISQITASQPFIANVYQPQFARSNVRALRIDYRRALFTFTALFGIPAAILMANSHSIVMTVLGPQWEGAVPVLAALALSGYFRVISAVQAAWFSVTRLNRLLRNRSIVFMVAGLAIIMTAPLIGIVAVAWLMAAKNLAIFMASARYTRSIMKLKTFLIENIAVVAVAAAAAFAVSFGLNLTHSLDKWPYVVWAISGLAAYAVPFAIWRKPFLGLLR